jgi:hypothetical protein
VTSLLLANAPNNKWERNRSIRYLKGSAWSDNSTGLQSSLGLLLFCGLSNSGYGFGRQKAALGYLLVLIAGRMIGSATGMY